MDTSTEVREHQFRREDLEDFDPGFPVPEEAFGRTPDGSILDEGPRVLLFAQALVRNRGWHLPMVMIYEDRDLPPTITTLHGADPQELTLTMEDAVEDVRRCGAEGVVYVSAVDLRKRPLDELVVAALTSDGARRVWRVPVKRDPDGAVSLGETSFDEGGAIPDVLLPIDRVWIAMGKPRLV